MYLRTAGHCCWALGSNIPVSEELSQVVPTPFPVSVALIKFLDPLGLSDLLNKMRDLNSVIPQSPI